MYVEYGNKALLLLLLFKNLCHTCVCIDYFVFLNTYIDNIVDRLTRLTGGK